MTLTTATGSLASDPYNISTATRTAPQGSFPNDPYNISSIQASAAWKTGFTVWPTNVGPDREV